MKSTNKEIAEIARLLITAKTENKAFKKELRKFRENNECEGEQVRDDNSHCFRFGLPVEEACSICQKADAIWRKRQEASKRGATLIRKLERLCLK